MPKLEKATTPPLVALGLTVYNGERYLTETLNSIIDQTFTDFQVFIVDDGSSDRSWQILCGFEGANKRLHIFRNDKRSGACCAWRQVFDHAEASGALYFAWVADHDVYERDWLEALVSIISSNDSIVGAFGHAERIDHHGGLISCADQHISIVGDGVMARLISQVVSGRSYGNMIYGLFRLHSVSSVSGYPNLLLPDTVLLWLLSLEGNIVYVPQARWKRRFVDLFSIKRQRKTLFKVARLYHYLPYYLINSIYIATRRNRIGQGYSNWWGGYSLCYGAAYFIKFLFWEIKRITGLFILPRYLKRRSD